LTSAVTSEVSKLTNKWLHTNRQHVKNLSKTQNSHTFIKYKLQT